MGHYLISFVLVLAFQLFAGRSTAWGMEEGTASPLLSEMRQLIQIYPNSKAFSDRIRAYSINERKEMILAYSSRFVQELDPTSETELHFYRFLKVSDALLGKGSVCHYFYDCSGESAIITVEGLNLIIDSLKEKGELGDTVALSIRDFQRKLPFLVFLPHFEKTFLVWHGDKRMIRSPNINKHITPVFIRKNQDGVTAIIGDSLGRSNLDYSESIRNILNQSRLRYHNLNIYVSTLARQKDSFSCPIFSLLDAREHHKSNLFSYIDQASQNGDEESKEASEHEGETSGRERFFLQGGEHRGVKIRIPLQFVQQSQTFSTLNEFLSESQRNHTTQSYEVLNLLKEFSFDEDGKAKSGYVRKHAYLYYSEILKHVVRRTQEWSFW